MFEAHQPIEPKPTTSRRRRVERSHRRSDGGTVARFTRTAWPLAAILALSACGAGDRTDAGPIVRDSAGIEIVENAAPTWSGEARWRLSSEPVVNIGALDGPAEQQLFRVTDAALFPDGRLVVANRGTAEIRIYGASGDHLRTLGREGDGPGEFQRLADVVVLPGDSIAAYDSGNHRLTVFTPDGELSRTVSLEQAVVASLGGLHALADGGLVLGVTGWSSAQLGPDERGPGRLLRFPSPILRYSPDGSLADTVGVFPGMSMATWGTTERLSMGVPFFGHRLTFDVHGGDVYVGTQERYEVTVYGVDGSPRQIVRGPMTDLTITDADIAELRERLLASAPEEMENPEQQVDERLEEVPTPDRRAAFERLLVDAAGNLWIGESDGQIGTTSTSWTIFDADGRMLGDVEVPERFTVYEIGEDYVLGRWRDDLDVEHVRVYGLSKEG